MVTVADILRYLNTIAPPYMKMEWDNVGLLCGRKNKEVKKVLIALDPFEAVCTEAAEINAQLLVTHHPLIFRPVKSITDENEVGRCIQILCRNDISAINAHTNLDCAPDGVNNQLALKLGLDNIQVISPNGTDEHGRPWGLLRMGTVSPQPLEQFLENVKSQLECDGLRYVNVGKSVTKVAVGGGACASDLLDAVAAGCDTFVTADVKYNQFFDAQSMGVNLIDAGHFQTENPIISLLAQKLSNAFPELQIVISEKHKDCMKFY